MFQFTGFASLWLYIHQWDTRGITLGGFPHSGIFGSTPACGSPKLIAANHALLRFRPPRHPPCALSSLTIKPFADFQTAYRLKTRVRNKQPGSVGRHPRACSRVVCVATKTLREFKSNNIASIYRVFVRLFNCQRVSLSRLNSRSTCPMGLTWCRPPPKQRQRLLERR